MGDTKLGIAREAGALVLLVRRPAEVTLEEAEKFSLELRVPGQRQVAVVRSPLGRSVLLVILVWVLAAVAIAAGNAPVAFPFLLLLALPIGLVAILWSSPALRKARMGDSIRVRIDGETLTVGNPNERLEAVVPIHRIESVKAIGQHVHVALLDGTTQDLADLAISDQAEAAAEALSQEIEQRQAHAGHRTHSRTQKRTLH